MLWAIKNYYIGSTEGLSGNIHLLDTASAFVGGEGAGPHWRFTDTGFEADMLVVGTTAANAAANADAISVMLSRANRASGAYGLGAPIVLSCELYDGTWRFLDITGGAISPVRAFIGGTQAQVTLALTTLPFARGAAVSVAASATLTNGTGAVLSVLDIPGDVPALLRVTASDVSTGTAVMTRLRLVTRAMPQMVPGTDVTLITDLTASGAGVATAEANTIGGTYSALTPSADWQTAGYANKPAAQYSLGLMDVYARVRDAYSGLTAPLSLTATAKTEGISQRQAATVNVTAVTTIAATLGQVAKAGTVIALQFGVKSRTAAPVTPTGFTAGPAQVHGSAAAGSYIYYKIADGTEQSFTIIWTGSADANLVVSEWYGLALSGILDVSASATTAGTSHLSGTTAVGAQANELTLSVHTVAAAVALTKAADFSFTNNAFTGYMSAYRVETSTAAKSHTATTAAAQSGAGVILVLKGRETAAENLAAATYQYQIVPYDGLGNVGSSSDVVAVAVAANGAAVLNWTAGGGSVTSYRVYWNSGAGWKYLAYASTNAYYVHYTETSAITDNPTSASSVPGQWRAQVSLPSGTTFFSGAGAESTMGGLAWHLIYLGTFPLPPLPALDADVLQSWRVTLQAKRVDGTTDALAADALYLFPHDEAQFVATYTGLNLATKRDWVIETRRDGRTFGLLRTTGTSTDAGQLDVAGQAMIGPGDAAIMVHADRAGGVSDVVDSKLTLALRYVPRYRTIARGAG